MLRLLVKYGALCAFGFYVVVFVVGPDERAGKPKPAPGKPHQVRSAPNNPVAANAACPLPPIPCPLPRCELTSRFTLAGRKNPVNGVFRPHEGADYAGYRAQPLYAPRSGVIERVGRDFVGYGKFAVILHDDGTRLLIAHMFKIRLKAGTRVHGGGHGKGSIFGYVGSTGTSTGPHAHIEYITPGGRKIDPEPCLVRKNATDHRQYAGGAHQGG